MEPTTISTPPFATSHEHLLAGLAYIDVRIRWAVARARAKGLDPFDEFRGLYISDSHIDTLLADDAISQHLWQRPSANGNGHIETNKSDWQAWHQLTAEARAQWQARTNTSRNQSILLRLDALIHAFSLTPTEVDIFLVALAAELDPRYERIFAYLHDDVTQKRPSVNLILNLLTDSFSEKLQLRHLLSDTGQLIKTKLLIRFSDGPSKEPTLLSQFMRPATTVVDYLLGYSGLDNELVGIATLKTPNQPTPPTGRVAAQLVENLVYADQQIHTANKSPLFVFIGRYGVGRQEIARYLADLAEKPLLSVNLAELEANSDQLRETLGLILRDGRLHNAYLYLTGWDHISQKGTPPTALINALTQYPHTVIVAGQTVWQPKRAQNARSTFVIEFNEGSYDIRLQTWQKHLGDKADSYQLDLGHLSNHFRFTPGQIEDVITSARDLALWHQRHVNMDDLLHASRAHSNQKLNTMATKIQPHYRWQDIVLPKDTLRQLKEMVNMARQRPLVYNEWGFADKMALGKGINALFAGESGTGKTMSADIMAGELGLDLYKIDLSTVISKYIGETEKNLEQIFTEASTSNAILFFDEADAIFGKRSEVKDSHDRYANIEISYLLQRMEAYDGIVILATNLRANLDEAFTRRLHFSIDFMFPEAIDRERIFRVNFPKAAPVASDIDFKYLSEHFRMAGGNIRNVILTAAFLAAESNEAVTMAHLLHAVRREYQKMGRLIHEKLFHFEASPPVSSSKRRK